MRQVRAVVVIQSLYPLWGHLVPSNRLFLGFPDTSLTSPLNSLVLGPPHKWVTLRGA